MMRARFLAAPPPPAAAEEGLSQVCRRPMPAVMPSAPSLSAYSCAGGGAAAAQGRPQRPQRPCAAGPSLPRGTLGWGGRVLTNGEGAGHARQRAAGSAQCASQPPHLARSPTPHRCPPTSSPCSSANAFSSRSTSSAFVPLPDKPRSRNAACTAQPEVPLLTTNSTTPYEPGTPKQQRCPPAGPTHPQLLL
jgi:hypothetical protein